MINIIPISGKKIQLSTLRKIILSLITVFWYQMGHTADTTYYKVEFIDQHSLSSDRKSNLSAIDHYVLGRKSFLTNDFEAALKAFKLAVAVDENFTPARAYLGLTFNKLGLLDAAAYHYRFALQADLPEDIAVLIENFLYEYDKKNGFNYYLKGNLSKGTNPNLQFERDTITVGGLVLTIDEANKAKSETTLELLSNANYTKQINESIKLQSAININGKYYKNSKSHEYSIEPSATLFYKKDLQSNYSFTLFNENKFGTENKVIDGLGARIIQQKSFGRNILMQNTLQYKNFDNLINEDKDGEEYAAFASLSYLSKNNTIVKYGLEHTQHKIGIKSLSSKLNSFNLSISKPLPNRIRSNLSLSLSDQRFNANSGIFGKKRQDKLLKAKAKLHFDKFEFQGLSPYLETTYTKRKSTITEFNSSDSSVIMGIDFAY